MHKVQHDRRPNERCQNKHGWRDDCTATNEDRMFHSLIFRTSILRCWRGYATITCRILLCHLVAWFHSLMFVFMLKILVSERKLPASGCLSDFVHSTSFSRQPTMSPLDEMMGCSAHDARFISSVLFSECWILNRTSFLHIPFSYSSGITSE